MALLQARAAAAGALSPSRRTGAPDGDDADGVVSSLRKQLVDSERRASGLEAKLSESRAQAEEAGGLVGELAAELEAVKAQVSPSPF